MEAGAEPAIQVSALTKTFGEGASAVYALRGVDLTVPRGEIVFLSGPSGSGKTTLVSIVGCVLRATSGTAALFGRDVTSLDEGALAAVRLETIGFVFQGHNLIASLSALENVRLPLLMRGVGVKQAEARAAEELARVGLGDKLDRKPRDLSGGQKQRVAIARAIVGRPPLILADEPTASLDARSGHEVMDILTRLAREAGTTVCVVTHDNRIYEFADRRISIEDGRIVGSEDQKEAA